VGGAGGRGVTSLRLVERAQRVLGGNDCNSIVGGGASVAAGGRWDTGEVSGSAPRRW
jgi:hypothetical protein